MCLEANCSIRVVVSQCNTPAAVQLRWLGSHLLDLCTYVAHQSLHTSSIYDIRQQHASCYMLGLLTMDCLLLQ